MIVVTAQNFIDLNKLNEFKELSEELIRKTLNENGCIEYEVFRDKDNKELFCFVEKWKSKKDLEKHFESEHFKKIVPKIGKIKIKKDIVNVYEKFN